jgi:hypothetical protein
MRQRVCRGAAVRAAASRQARALPRAEAMQRQTPARQPARPDLSANEQRWHELNAELEALEEALRNLQPPAGALITPELFDQLEAIKRRRYQLQATMLDFLDTLDDMPP